MTTTSRPLTAAEIECLTEAAEAEDLADRIRGAARILLNLSVDIPDDELDAAVANALANDARPQGEYIRAAAGVIFDCNDVLLIDQDIDDLLGDLLGLEEQ